MDKMKQYYQSLTVIINEKLEESGFSKIYFDSSEGIDENLFCYPVHKLLNITNEEKFVNECFLKILDRPINKENLHLIDKLKQNQLSKIQIIEILYNSKERKGKFLDLNFKGIK